MKILDTQKINLNNGSAEHHIKAQWGNPNCVFAGVYEDGEDLILLTIREVGALGKKPLDNTFKFVGLSRFDNNLLEEGKDHVYT